MSSSAQMCSGIEFHAATFITTRSIVALVVTLGILLRLINCRCIVITSSWL